MMQSDNNSERRELEVSRPSTVGMNPTARFSLALHASRGVHPHGPSLQADLVNGRRGFTLVELMVVVVVIALLVAILGASLAFMGQQAKEAATNAVIKKIHTQLDQRMEAFDRQFGLIETSARLDPDYERAKAYVYNASPGLNGEQLRIMVRKQLSRSNFPQTFADIGLTAPAGHTSITESSEMLYYMLTEMKVGEAPPVDAGEFLAGEVADTDNDGLLEFVDGWGNPLRFYRWPTRLIRPDFDVNDQTADDPDHVNAPLLIQGLPGHSAEQMLKTDPDDPVGVLDNVVSYFESNPPSFEERFHTPNTYFAPLIVSAGADGELGLFEPYETLSTTGNLGYLARPDATNLSALTDNITNRNQRAGD